MSVFQHLKEGKYQIELLKGQIPYIKDQKKLDRFVALINTMINLINSVESLSQKELNTDVIDKLLLARFYSQIYPLEFSTDPLNIHQIVANINNNIAESLNMMKQRVVASLISKEVFHLVDKVPVNKRLNGGVDVDYSKMNKTKIDDFVIEFRSTTPSEEYGKMIDDLLMGFKEQIK